MKFKTCKNLRKEFKQQKDLDEYSFYKKAIRELSSEEQEYLYLDIQYHRGLRKYRSVILNFAFVMLGYWLGYETREMWKVGGLTVLLVLFIIGAGWYGTKEGKESVIHSILSKELKCDKEEKK